MLLKTVEAEVKTSLPLQRARIAENRADTQDVIMGREGRGQRFFKAKNRVLHDGRRTLVVRCVMAHR